MPERRHVHRTASLFVPRLVVLAAVLFGPAASPRAAAAQCTTTALVDGSAALVPGAGADYRFVQPAGFFMAVGMRSASASDHRLDLYAQTAASPTCLQTLLASSNRATGVDLVVGDFRPGHNPVGTRYPRVTRTAGTGSAVIEWEDSARVLVPGTPPTRRTVPLVLDVFQAFLEQGSSYTLNLADSGGADVHVLVFRNAAGGALWAPRGAPEQLADLAGPTLFTAPASDDYAFVVVNDDGGTGTYTFWIEQCQEPVPIAAGVPQPAAYPWRYSFTPVDPYWTAIGTRSLTADWNAAVYDTGRGNQEPECFARKLAESARPGGVDFVVGDLFNAPLRATYARLTQASGTGGAQLHWDAGPDTLPAETVPVPLTFPIAAGEVVRIWDVPLVPGSGYQVQFTPSGAAQLAWFVFENRQQDVGGLYWAGREGAIASGTGDGYVQPSSIGYHGFAVTNENGQDGSFTVAFVRQTQVGAAPPGGWVSGLGAIAPNPARGRSLVSFTLARPGRVRLEAIDVAGRVVARLDGGERPAGPGALEWRAAGAPAGVYFVRLRVDGAVVGRGRLVLVE